MYHKFGDKTNVHPTKNEDHLKRVSFSRKVTYWNAIKWYDPQKKSQTKKIKNSHKPNRKCRRHRFIAQVKGSVVSQIYFPKVHKWVIVKESLWCAQTYIINLNVVARGQNDFQTKMSAAMMIVRR